MDAHMHMRTYMHRLLMHDETGGGKMATSAMTLGYAGRYAFVQGLQS